MNLQQAYGGTMLVFDEKSFHAICIVASLLFLILVCQILALTKR